MNNEKVISEAIEELRPWCDKIKNGDSEWFDEMDKIILEYALEYGVSSDDIDYNRPNYLAFFERVVTDNPAFD